MKSPAGVSGTESLNVLPMREAPVNRCLSRIVVVAFDSSPIPTSGASRLGNVGLSPKPIWGHCPQTPSSLRAYGQKPLEIT
ncbi:MAG: hypothetical protein IJV91_05945, partial [Kiritimatiellae bacterium]|nr:hypothetical protein [Kiritimatiellia bacterium]